MDIITRYARDVVYGDLKELCCKWEILACKRHLYDMQRQGLEGFPYVFDITRAERIFRSFSLINRLDVPGQNIELEDWQAFDLGCIFGWVHKDTGQRRFKTAYTRIARGHAKTTNAAGVALYVMCGDGLYPPGRPELVEYELQPEVVVVAVDAIQANIAFEDIKSIGENSKAVTKRLNIKQSYIKHKTRGGNVLKFSKDTKNKDGGRPSLIILEEWHAHPTSAVRDVAVSSKGKKKQCLEYIITTAGTDAENKPCFKDDNFYKAILEGAVNQEDIFVMVREIDDGDDPHNESCWVKANPFFRKMGDYAKNLYSEVKSQYETAFNSGDPAKIREFMIKRMNRWQADSEAKYMSGIMDIWKDLGVSKEEFARLTKGIKGYRGLDLSKSIDLTADSFVGWLADGRLAVSAFGFIPDDAVAKHEHTDRVPYKEWAKEGRCQITPGAVTDYSFIKSHIQETEAENKWNAKEICFDPYNSSHFMQDMEKDGYTPVEIRQGVQTLSEPTKKLRELILQKRVVHDGSPLLTWCLSNAVEVIDNNGNIKLSKKHKDDSQRIDLAAAVINALVRALDAEPLDINKIIQSGGWSM